HRSARRQDRSGKYRTGRSGRGRHRLPERYAKQLPLCGLAFARNVDRQYQLLPCQSGSERRRLLVWDNTSLTTTAAAAINYSIFGTNTGGWGAHALSPYSYVPVDFQYTIGPPSSSSFVTNKTLGTLRNNWDGWVGMQITVGASPLTVTALGRIM